MNFRTGLLAVSLTALAAPVARGQGVPTKAIVISESALKAMSAAKPKTKKPLAARLAVKRQSSVTKSSGHTAPATVSEITPVSRK